MYYQIENISYDYSKGIILKNGSEIELTKIQRDLLNFYVDNPRTIASKTTIMENVWGRIVTNNSVDQVNSVLRNHLEKDPTNPRIIVSHFGKGISFEVDVKKQLPITETKRSFFKPLVFLSILVSCIALYAYFLEPKSTASSPIVSLAKAHANRLMFIPGDKQDNRDYNQNSATQLLISELLRFSNNNDIVDTSRYPDSDKKLQFAEDLWQLNPKLNLVKTQLIEIEKKFILSVEMMNADRANLKQEFSATTIYEVVLSAVSWIGQENAHRSLDSNLLEMLPNNNYLVETYMRGFAFINSGESAKAIEYFKLCLQEKPDFHLARISLANALRRYSQYDEAIVQLETLRSVNLDSNLAIVVDSEFAAVQLIRGDLLDAKKMFEKIINDYPMSFRLYPAYMNLAATEYRMGNYDEALKQLLVLEKIINEKTHPEDAGIISFTMSGVYMYQKQLSESNKYLNKSLSLFKQANDIQREGMVLARMSNYHLMMGDLQNANIFINQSYEIANQLGNKRSQLAALNHMVEFKIIEGFFDKADQLNQKLSHLATEMNSLSGKIRVAQWNSELLLERKQYTQAEKQIEYHLKLAKERDSKPSLNTNLILQLELALKLNNNNKAIELINQLQQMSDKDILQSELILLHAEYLFTFEQQSQAIAYLKKQKILAFEHKDENLAQQLDILLAEKYLLTKPDKAVEILEKSTINDLNKHPYYSLFAQALFNTGKYIEALVQMEKAKQAYNQRWNQRTQQLYQQIKKAIDGTL